MGSLRGDPSVVEDCSTFRLGGMWGRDHVLSGLVLVNYFGKFVRGMCGEVGRMVILTAVQY